MSLKTLYMSFRINYTLDPEYLRAYENGNISGQLSISINDKDFPSLYWNDLIAKVLNMWCYYSLSLINGESVEEFDFMDGSYSFIVRILPNRKIHLRCVEDYKDTDLSNEIALKDFLKEIISASTAIIDYFNKMGLESNDIKGLEKSLERLIQGARLAMV